MSPCDNFSRMMVDSPFDSSKRTKRICNGPRRSLFQFQPQEMTVKRLEMQDILCRTIPRRKSKTQATRMTVQTPDHVDPLPPAPTMGPLRSASSIPKPSSPIANPRGSCSGIVTTATPFCWGRKRQPSSPGKPNDRSFESGNGSM